MKILLAGAAALLGVSMLTACSDTSETEPTAEERACSARSQLSDDYDALVADLKSANFGDASDQLAVIGDDLDEVSAAVEDLSAEKRDAVQPLVDDLKTTVGSLQDSTTLVELQTGLTTAGQQFTEILDTLVDQADCGS